jgi:hypothetical protein
LTLARRLVAERCLYGVDKNPLAVEMARLSLWINTLAKDRTFTFLNHALKGGDSLVGVDAERLLRWATAANTPAQTAFFYEDLATALQEAVALRRELTGFSVVEPEDIERKAALHARAEAALARLRLAGDLIIGAHFAEPDPKARNALLAELLEAFAQFDEQTPGDDSALLTRHPSLARVLAAAERVRPFHWPFEFPEVFLPPHADPPLPAALTSAGFDAFIGNPPFLGGLRISTVSGPEYLAYLREYYPSSHGTADLCAFFFLRAFGRLNRRGDLGLIATNTLAQGDTRETGLEKIVKAGGTIYAATSSMPWPGTAAVFVAVVHAAKYFSGSKKVLNGLTTPIITSMLDATSTLGKPKILEQNGAKSFIGAYVLGTGFILTPEEAQVLIETNPKNAEVLFPYLNGQDPNTSPDQSPSRWAINFGERSLEEAEHYPDCLKIVREKVYPQRMAQKDKIWPRLLVALFAVRARNAGSFSSMSQILLVLVVTKNTRFCICPKRNSLF